MHSLLAPAITLAILPMILRALPAGPPPAGVQAPPALAAATAEDPGEPVFVGVDRERITAERLARFLAAHGSPLAEHARQIVAAGVKHGVDPRWVVAIAGTETYFGRYHKGYNAWGWDAPNGLRRWTSWDDAIESYTRHFARGYRSRDPLLIGARYAPFAPHWPETTRLFFSRI